MPRAGSGRSPKGIQSVEIGIRVLKAVAEGAGPLSLTRVAAAVGMQPSHVYRYLVSLQRGGLLTQAGSTGLYDLGPECSRLGMEAMRRVDEVSIASEYLARLRDRTGYAVELCSWTDSGAMMVRWQDGAVPLPVRIRVGSVVPMLESAAGRVFLAFLPRAVTAPVVRAQLAASISEPLPDEALQRILAEVRSSGVAVARGAFVRGTVALAAPIFNGERRLVLVMALLAPSVRVPDSALPKLTAALREAAAGVSRDLGYVAPSGASEEG